MSNPIKKGISSEANSHSAVSRNITYIYGTTMFIIKFTKAGN
jgi:hypothetical protein